MRNSVRKGIVVSRGRLIHPRGARIFQRGTFILPRPVVCVPRGALVRSIVKTFDYVGYTSRRTRVTSNVARRRNAFDKTIFLNALLAASLARLRSAYSPLFRKKGRRNIAPLPRRFVFERGASSTTKRLSARAPIRGRGTCVKAVSEARVTEGWPRVGRYEIFCCCLHEGAHSAPRARRA